MLNSNWKCGCLERGKLFLSRESLGSAVDWEVRLNRIQEISSYLVSVIPAFLCARGGYGDESTQGGKRNFLCVSV